ncbi:MAG: PIN domain-containing protein [Chloroflexi bacterium]|nr:PIN domain-containing protein [Chloroflexota bacterium]MDA8189626.1 PIN domain-containing protein [Dehalococcoidales bacterium]
MTAQVSDRYLLDTSAILTLIEDEPGADRVEEVLRTEDVLLPFVAGLETYYITLLERGADEADHRLLLLRQLPVRWLDTVSDIVLVTAGCLKAQHHLSFADCLIAAFATEAAAILVHKDPEYDVLNSLRQERLPYRGGQPK